MVSVFHRLSMQSTHLTEPPWRFRFENITLEAWRVWVEFYRRDTDTGKWGWGRGRDMVIHAGTSISGVVKTMFLQVRLVVEHELFHAFKFDGVSLFDPHVPVELLTQVSGAAKTDAYNNWNQTPLKGSVQ